MQRNRHLLPEFPRTPHLPYHPNTTPDDLIADLDDVQHLKDIQVVIEEKIDGANCGVHWSGGDFIVRNRSHILRKGFLGRTSAKNQFRPLWNWVHDHLDNFAVLAEFGGFNQFAVYGEWCWMAHGIHYDALPDFLIAFDIYVDDQFLSDSRSLLEQSGFHVPPLVYKGEFPDYDRLEIMTQQDSPWINHGDRRREGIYIRSSVSRYKMVRSDFVRGSYFGNQIIRNYMKK